MMTREEAHKMVPVWIDEKTDKRNAWHYGQHELHRDIDRIFDGVEKKDDEQEKEKQS